jgi:FkbM family methyltransferase
MNPRYLLGRTLTASHTWLLSRRWFPLLRSYARGHDWAYDICRIRGRRRADVIFDVGANVGQTSVHLLRYFPSSRLHAFELVEATSRELARRLAPHPGARAHHVALGAQPGRVRIALQGCSETNSLLFATADSGAGAEEVVVDTVDAFCAMHGIGHIDILKTDAQGSDLDVLRGAEGMLTGGRVSFVFSEAGFTPSQPDLQPFAALDAHLKARDFRLAGIYEQWWLRSELISFNALYFHRSVVSA